MKTAVSIPDRVFAEAEHLAKRLKKSRSQVYAEALAEYTARHDEDHVTERVNAALEAVGEQHQDPALAEAVYRVLRNVEW
jgi:metal-responsive CopG/Arc/MetJ family transcriptional regulator